MRTPIPCDEKAVSSGLPRLLAELAVTATHCGAALAHTGSSAKEKGPRGRAFSFPFVSAGDGSPPAFNGVQSGRISVPPAPSRKKRVKKVIFLAPISALLRASHFVNEKFTCPQSGILRRFHLQEMAGKHLPFIHHLIGSTKG